MAKAGVKKDADSIDLVINTAPLREGPPNWPRSSIKFIYDYYTKRGIELVNYTEQYLELLCKNKPLLLKMYTYIKVSPEAEAYEKGYIEEILGEKMPVYSIKLPHENFNAIIKNAKRFESIANKGFVSVDQLFGGGKLNTKRWLEVGSEKYRTAMEELNNIEQVLDKFVESMLCFENAREYEIKNKELSEQTTRQGYKLLKELFS